MSKNEYFLNSKCLNSRLHFKNIETKHKCRSSTRDCTRAEYGLFSSNRSQMKIMEMSFMILALFLFFVMVGLFFLASYTSDLRTRANLLYRQGTINTLAALSGTPEFTCGESNCVDLDKMIALKGMIGGDYKNFWNIGSLKIVRVYPSLAQQECVNNLDDCNSITIKEKETGDNEVLDWTFVSACRKESKDNYIYDKCEIGRIVAGTVEKT